MQTNIAAMTADPVDLVRGRTPTPGDLTARLADIEAVRAGESPASDFPTSR